MWENVITDIGMYDGQDMNAQQILTCGSFSFTTSLFHNFFDIAKQRQAYVECNTIKIKHFVR